MASELKEVRTPYLENYSMGGLHFLGKMDDISVVLARCVRRQLDSDDDSPRSESD